jgi:hypothetical protein
MKNIMRAISLGLVCAIAVSNIAQANQTDEKSPTKWEMAKNIGCAIGALPVFLVSCALLKKPSRLVANETIKATLECIKPEARRVGFFEFVRAEQEQVIAEQKSLWRFKKALAGLGFATSFAIKIESIDREADQICARDSQDRTIEHLKWKADFLSNKLLMLGNRFNEHTESLKNVKK